MWGFYFITGWIQAQQMYTPTVHVVMYRLKILNNHLITTVHVHE